jgi:hypothetical protein
MSAAGVKIKVNTVLNDRPNTIDDASNVHHSTTRLPINISLDNTSMLTPTARGEGQRWLLWLLIESVSGAACKPS